MQNSNHLCAYCGQPANYQFKNGKWCCSKRNSLCPAIKKQISLKAKIMWNELKSQGLSVLKDKKNEKENIIPNICAYCKKPAQYQLKNGKWCCCPSYNQCPELRRKNYSFDGKSFNGKLRAEQYSKESRLKQGWNRGLTKENNEKIKLIAEKLKERYKNGELKPSWLGRKHSNEEIDKIVNGMTHFRKNGNLKGFKYGWYKGYWCDSSWELAYVIYNLEHDIKFERNTLGFNYIDSNGKRRRYYPDFIIDRNLL